MKINNVSFVLIARNEGGAIAHALNSLAATHFVNCQIILVDSCSTDNTLSIMNEYAEEHSNWDVITCSGILNAAKVRNVGFMHATNDFVFFVDGDTEIDVDFVICALKEFECDECVGVTGQLAEKIYNKNYSDIIKFVRDRFNIGHKKFVMQTGGNVILRRATLEEHGAWNELFNINEDFEITLRLSQYGTIIALPILMGTHHTLEYTDRIILHASKGYARYIGYLLRININNPAALKVIIKNEVGTFIGFVFYCMAFAIIVLEYLTPDFDSKIGWLIFVFLLVVDFLNGVRKKKNIVQRLINRLVNPFVVIFGFMMFTVNNKNYENRNLHQYSKNK